MAEFNDNVYNRILRQDEAKLKVWRYAGLMLTYKCPASCEFCYYNCGPDQEGMMSVDTAITSWEGLETTGGQNARVHITGGEPFLYFDRLCEIMREAKKLGLQRAASVETNGFWATDDGVIIERLKRLDDLGMDRLKISWDPFHAEYIDIESVRRLRQRGAELLGDSRVLVRWEKYLQEPVTFENDTQINRSQAYRSAIADFPCRFTGRAGGNLAQLFANKTAESIAEMDCSSSFLSAKGVHIDPYGNVFSGLCSGIMLGNVNSCGLDEMWSQFEPPKRELIGTLFSKGPAGLLQEAESVGYQRRHLYADKCHLCTELREFFFDNGDYETIIGPCECYSHQDEKNRRLFCE